MNKLFLICFSLLFFFLFNRQIVLAVPAAPSPVCEIMAEIINLEKTKTQRPDVPAENQFDYYKVNLKISSISTWQKEGTRVCDNSLIESAQNSILTAEEYNLQPILVGQKIKAKITFDGDEWFGGYFLSAIEIQKNSTNINVNKQAVDNQNINQQEVNNHAKVQNQINNQLYLVPLIIILVIAFLYVITKLIKR
jgi:hypothetical protein